MPAKKREPEGSLNILLLDAGSFSYDDPLPMPSLKKFSDADSFSYLLVISPGGVAIENLPGEDLGYDDNVITVALFEILVDRGHARHQRYGSFEVLECLLGWLSRPII